MKNYTWFVSSCGYDHVLTSFCRLFESNPCNIKDFTAIWRKSTPTFEKFFRIFLRSQWTEIIIPPSHVVLFVRLSSRHGSRRGLWKGQFSGTPYFAAMSVFFPPLSTSINAWYFSWSGLQTIFLLVAMMYVFQEKWENLQLVTLFITHHMCLSCEVSGERE